MHPLHSPCSGDSSHPVGSTLGEGDGGGRGHQGVADGQEPPQGEQLMLLLSLSLHSRGEDLCRGRAFGTFLTCQERSKPTWAGERAHRTPQLLLEVFLGHISAAAGDRHQSEQAVPAALLYIRS